MATLYIHALDQFVAICDSAGMELLKKYIADNPDRTLSQHAKDFGVSRPFLYALRDGLRQPSLSVAVRIAEATNGNIPVSSWPNLSAVLRAVKEAS